MNYIQFANSGYSFDPPGQMSAGLTCELFVTFKPMINEDLAGTVQFLSQTGPFEIPLICTTKKCDVSIVVLIREVVMIYIKTFGIGV